VTGEVLSTRGVGVRYGTATAVAGVDLDFVPGAINAVVGPNGAGKSSLLLALYGSVAYTGTISLGGAELPRAGGPAARARQGVALVPQGRQIVPTLTVRENLEVMAEVLGVGRSGVDRALARFPVLVERSRSLAGVLSGGEQQMLAVTRALMAEPCRVLLLDEMATGLAPLVVQALMATVRDLADAGATVVMAEASIGAISGDIDHGVVLLRGEVLDVADGGETLDRHYQQRMGIVA
jgi:branched-chain amino acid transport system ATP-binding protein